MIKQLGQYGAVCAKVRGMYGKRLTVEDWERLYACADVEQATDFLDRSPGWGPLSGDAKHGNVKQALHKRVLSEYEHLEHFVQNGADKKYMGYFLGVKEHTQAMGSPGYREAWAYLVRDYKGLSAVALRELLGAEADMLNVTYLLRLRQFPALREKGGNYLIPVHLQLTPQLARKVLDAPDENAVKAALHGTRMAAVVASGTETPEACYRMVLETMCRKLVTGAAPSLAVPAAYLTLKDLECRKLSRLIEALRLGLGPRRVH